jgi:hypothetical protein
MTTIPDALRLLRFAARETWQLRRIEGMIATPYLTSVPSSAFVHEIHTPDGDRHMHDHPWEWSAAVVLSGGYTELREDGGLFGHEAMYEHELTHAVGDLNTFFRGDYHRITHVDPDTVTLFLCGRESHDWGFLVDGAHVPHKEYFASRDGAGTKMETVRL